jgi:hypothetical protein
LAAGLPLEVAVVETIGGKPMVRFRSNVMSIFVASALVLFMSAVKNAFAHPASPAVAKAFSAQEPQDPNEKDAKNNDAQHEDMDDRDVDNIDDGAKDDMPSKMLAYTRRTVPTTMRTVRRIRLMTEKFLRLRPPSRCN